MHVREVMSRHAVCCLPTDPASKAAVLMRDRDIGIVPVIDNDRSRRIVGVVTDRDLAMCVVAPARDPKHVLVRECMTAKVVSCGLDDEIADVIRLMQANRVRRIPVGDRHHRIQGVVSMADLVLHGELPSRQTHDTLQTISQPTIEPSRPRALAPPRPMR